MSKERSLGMSQDIPESTAIREDYDSAAILEAGARLLPHSIAGARAAADRFFAHKAEHPDPVPEDQLTPLQQRMQSGGA